MTDIRAALDRLRPGAAWRNKPIDPDAPISEQRQAIIWQDQTTLPTTAELEQALADIAAEQAAAEAALAAEEQAARDARQNIQFLMSLMAADEAQIRSWIQNNGQETAIVRLTQVMQFILRWIRSREKRLPELADD